MNCPRSGRTVAVVLLAGFLAAFATRSSVYGESLLANSGFEHLDLNGEPMYWDHFVLEQTGARASVSDIAHSGGYSIMLYTPEPYDDEPFNNWSQNVTAKLAGKEVEISAHVKTDSVTEAAIWLQSWRRRPLRLIETATSSSETPIYGTHDWREVRFTATVPDTADVVVLRCVIRGTGSVWFDDVELRLKRGAPDFDVEFIEGPEERAYTKPKTEPAPPKEEDEVQSLVDANRALQDALNSMRKSNQSLAKELDDMRSERDKLRADLELLLRTQRDLHRQINAGDLLLPLLQGGTDSTELTRPSPPTPPIVPRGYDWNDLRSDRP